MLTLSSVVMLTKDFSDDEKKRFRDLMYEEGRKMCPNDGGSLKGTAIVAIGKK